MSRFGSAAQLIVVRHGRTTLNKQGRLQGRVDAELDDVGRQQATQIANALREVDIARIVSSPLLRAVQTAEPLLAQGKNNGGLRRPERIETDERWIELDYGEFDGRPMGDVPAETWAEWRRSIDFALPGGESLAALGHRVRESADELLSSMADPSAESGSIVVFTHVSPIKAAVAWGLGAPDEVSWRTFVGQASITRFGLAMGSSAGQPTPSLVGFNDINHTQ